MFGPASPQPRKSAALYLVALSSAGRPAIGQSDGRHRRRRTAAAIHPCDSGALSAPAQRRTSRRSTGPLQVETNSAVHAWRSLVCGNHHRRRPLLAGGRALQGGSCAPLLSALPLPPLSTTGAGEPIEIAKRNLTITLFRPLFLLPSRWLAGWLAFARRRQPDAGYQFRVWPPAWQARKVFAGSLACQAAAAAADSRRAHLDLGPDCAGASGGRARLGRKSRPDSMERAGEIFHLNGGLLLAAAN